MFTLVVIKLFNVIFTLWMSKNKLAVRLKRYEFCSSETNSTNTSLTYFCRTNTRQTALSKLTRRHSRVRFRSLPR